METLYVGGRFVRPAGSVGALAAGLLVVVLSGCRLLPDALLCIKDVV